MFIALVVMAIILFVVLLCCGSDVALPISIAYCVTAVLMVGFYVWSNTPR